MTIRKKLEDWYRGTYVPPPPNDPHSPVIFISPGHYEQPWFAKLMGAVGRFALAHWQWLIGIGLTIFSIIIAL